MISSKFFYFNIFFITIFNKQLFCYWRIRDYYYFNILVHVQLNQSFKNIYILQNLSVIENQDLAFYLHIKPSDIIDS